jgi:hypothetical protein
MDRDLTRYIVTYYSALMTPEERLALRHLTTTFKFTGGRSDLEAQQAVQRQGGPRARWLSDDPAVLRLAADGLNAFEDRVATRILAERREDVFLNYCPQCGGLTRTPKAKLCLHCGYSWHRKSAG